MGGWSPPPKSETKLPQIYLLVTPPIWKLSVNQIQSGNLHQIEAWVFFCRLFRGFCVFCFFCLSGPSRTESRISQPKTVGCWGILIPMHEKMQLPASLQSFCSEANYWKNPLQLAAGTFKKINKNAGFQKESPFTQLHFQVSGDTLIEVYPP